MVSQRRTNPSSCDRFRWGRHVTASGMNVLALIGCCVVGSAWVVLSTMPSGNRQVANAQAASDGSSADEPSSGRTRVLGLTAQQRAIQLLNRAAFGARPGDVERVVKDSWEAWVEEQLKPGRLKDRELDRRLKRDYPSLGLGLAEAYSRYWPEVPQNYEQMSIEKRNAFISERNRLRNLIQFELRESVLVRATYSERQLYEVMVEFWRNHFNIDQTKDDCQYFSNHYEETVIRRHCFGHFGNMLMASAQHPAMLIYLDNDVSQRPLTKEETRQLDLITAKRKEQPGARFGAYAMQLQRQRGLNENYARELLELHTLGVDRFYEQKDVREVARTLTGWSHGWAAEPYKSDYTFKFQKSVHDRKSKKILGVRISGKRGVRDGASVIRMLAEHPATAEFIAWKLCRYLVNDEPSFSLVERVAARFKESKGHLPTVYREILLSPEFMSPDNYRSKFKSPFEFVVSALRATGAQIENGGDVLYRLARMGQPLYQCEDPTGYFDRTADWLDPGVLVHRWDFALRLARNKIKGVRIPDKFWESIEKDDAMALLRKLMPDVLSSKTEVDGTLRRVVVQQKKRERRLGIILGAPKFQQQ